MEGTICGRYDSVGVRQECRNARASERETETLLALYGACWSRAMMHATRGADRAPAMWREYRMGFAAGTARRVRELLQDAAPQRRAVLLYLAEVAAVYAIEGARQGVRR